MTTEDLMHRKQEALWLQHERETFARREPRYCRHCQKDVLAIGPARWWRWAVPALALVGFLGLVAVVFLDPFGIFALFAAAMLIAMLGPFIALSRRPLRCPHCRREVPYHTKAEADAAERAELERADPRTA